MFTGTQLFYSTVRSCRRSAPFYSVLHQHPPSSPSPAGILLFRFSDYSAAVPRDDEEIRSMFKDWMKHYKKSYRSAEEKDRRLEIFKEAVNRVDEHNRPENGHSFRIGINKFSDLPNDEYCRIYSNRFEMFYPNWPPEELARRRKDNGTA